MFYKNGDIKVEAYLENGNGKYIFYDTKKQKIAECEYKEHSQYHGEEIILNDDGTI